MTCTFCPTEATAGGRLPRSASGQKYWLACATHENKIEKLHLIPMMPDEIDAEIKAALKREAKEKKS